jgi:hypothetical protein
VAVTDQDSRASPRERYALVGEEGLEVSDFLAELRQAICDLHLQRIDFSTLLGLPVGLLRLPQHATLRLLPSLLLVLALFDLALRLLHATGLTLNCDRLSRRRAKRNAHTF